MLIPIPIGAKHVAAVEGTVWKFVSCARCQQQYAYLLELEATGEDHDPLFLDGEGSAERAQAKAEQNLLEKGRNVVLPVPCPNCGFYQDDMSRVLKEEASINSLQIAGGVIGVLALVPLVFGIPYIWILTIVLAVAGLALLAYGYLVAFRFDPNAGDPERRKALGQRHAVWGERLAELLATHANALQDAAGAAAAAEVGGSAIKDVAMDWYDAAGRYYEQTRPHDESLSSLPAEWQRELVALMLLEEQMNNGAYLQFLANCGRTAYVYSREALEKIGAHRMAEIVDTCQALVDEHFPTEGMPQQERGQLLVNRVIDREGHTLKEAGSVLPEAVVTRVYELSYEYMSYPDKVWELAQRHYGPLIEGCK